MPDLRLREPDDDLILLIRKCKNEDLAPLVSYITQKGGVSSELGRTHAYKKHNPNHQMYADEIAAEIQKYGGNSIGNVLRRGRGVQYKKLVCNVANELKVNFNKASEIEFTEQQIMLKVLETAWEKMTDEEKQVFMEELGEKYKSMMIPKTFPMSTITAAIQVGGFVPYNLAAIVANGVAKVLIGRGISLAASAALTRSIAAFAGPIGWAITGLWTIFDITRPAYRVTIPCVLHIAMLRQKYLLEARGESSVAA